MRVAFLAAFLRRFVGSFEGELDTEWLQQKTMYAKLRVSRGFAFIDPRGRRWPVAAGDTTDGASFPWFLPFVPIVYLFARTIVMGAADPWPALWFALFMAAIIGAPLHHAYIEAATVHDVPGYRGAELAARKLLRAMFSRRRALCDRVFFEAIITRAWLRYMDESDTVASLPWLIYRVARALVMWLGVILGGWVAYRQHARRSYAAVRR
jgi:hypothetical protein